VVRCCGLSKEWYGGEGCDLHDLWLVLLESAKDRFLGVDTPEQPVPPRVRYGTACLLIRDVLGSVSCSVEREGYRDYLRAARCKRGRDTTTIPGNLSNARYATT
jgi:hypothetical protein